MKQVFIKNIALIIVICLSVVFFVGSYLFIRAMISWNKIPWPVAISSIQETSQTKDSTKKNLKPSNKIPVLMYHYIRDYRNIDDPLGVRLSVSPSAFDSQLTWLEDHGYQTITFQDIYQNKKMPEKPVILTFDDGYSDFYNNAMPILDKHGMKAVAYIIVDKISVPGYLDKHQIHQLSDRGYEIGSHTLSHLDLTKSPVEKAENEIAQSRAKLRLIFNIQARSFCYPSGRYNIDTEKFVNEAGYNYAVTTEAGIGKFEDPYAIPRLRMMEDTDMEKLFSEYL